MEVNKKKSQSTFLITITYRVLCSNLYNTYTYYVILSRKTIEFNLIVLCYINGSVEL